MGITYNGNVPAGLREKLTKFEDRVAEVFKGTRDDDWAYMVWYREGWVAADDCITSDIADTGRELLSKIRNACPGEAG